MLKEFFIVRYTKTMKKPWSITTTLRNPGRLRDFLVVLKRLENSKWTFENQIKYQILLNQIIVNFSQLKEIKKYQNP